MVKRLYMLAINLERGVSQQSIPWLGRSDSKGLPSCHVQGAWQTLFPILPCRYLLMAQTVAGQGSAVTL